METIECVFDVFIILAVAIVMVWRSYKKVQKSSQDVVEEKPLHNHEFDISSNDMSDLKKVPPIPPLSKQMNVDNKNNDEQLLGKEQTGEPIFDMDLRQAVIASEILKRKF